MNRFVIRPPNVHFVRLGETYNGQWPGSLLVQRTAPGMGQEIYPKVIMIPVPCGARVYVNDQLEFPLRAVGLRGLREWLASYSGLKAGAMRPILLHVLEIFYR